MATLKNIANDTFVVLDLKNTWESPDWIGYNITIFAKKDGSLVEVLKCHNPEILCLENSIEPEIPTLCNALETILKGELEDYTFEPIDEKNFRLEIKHEVSGYGDFFVTNFFICFPILFGNYKWDAYSSVGLQLNVEKKDLIEFATELRREYNNLGKSDAL